MELSRIVIGGMRFGNKDDAITVIRHAIDCGFNYIDTSPVYCRQSEEECSEAWIGEALSDPSYRSRIMVSTKCTPGNGGLGFDDNYRPEGGFGVRSKDQLDEVFKQSQRRLKMEHFDYYHLWTTHTIEQFNEAMKPGGWYEGVQEHRSDFDHFGVTTHADSDTIIHFLESGLFEIVTLPLNIINTTRMKAVEYCQKKGIKIIAMNPFAGGFLAQRDDLKELSLRYLLKLDNVYPLIGFSSSEEVDYAKHILETMGECTMSAEELWQAAHNLSNSDEPRCTACGYCQPCANDVNLGACLSYYNSVKYLNIESAKAEFQQKQWEDGLKLDNCNECMLCKTKCPNHLPLEKIIPEAKKLLYAGMEKK